MKRWIWKITFAFRLCSPLIKLAFRLACVCQLVYWMSNWLRHVKRFPLEQVNIKKILMKARHLGPNLFSPISHSMSWFYKMSVCHCTSRNIFRRLLIYPVFKGRRDFILALIVGYLYFNDWLRLNKKDHYVIKSLN